MPRAVLVLRPELTPEAVFGPSSPFAPLLPRAAIGVMNVAVRGPRDPASAYLALGAGERLAAGPLIQPARFAKEQVEGDPAAVVYARRLGPPPAIAHSPTRLLHLEWAAYLNSPDPTYTPNEQAAAGRLGQTLLPLGGAAWLGVGDATRTRLGALVAVDAAGTVRYGEALGVGSWGLGLRGSGRIGRISRIGPNPQRPTPNAQRLIVAKVSALLQRSPLVVLDLPSSFAAGRLAALLAALTQDPGRDVLLISPYPPPGPAGEWDRLPPILATGPGFRPGRLTSATTRTSGLVANIDVAPTLLAALGVARPRTMSGRVMSSSPAVRERGGSEGDAAGLLRIAQAATLSARAIIPIGATIEGGAVLVLLFIVLALCVRPRRHSALARFASIGMLLVAGLPLGLLLGPVTGPRTALGLGLAIAGWDTAAVAVAMLLARLQATGDRRQATGGGRRRSQGEAAPLSDLSPVACRLPPPPPLLWLAALTVGVVVSDLLLGGTLIARSPLSGFPVSGIRFYGIGNEYLGVLAGMGIVAPLLFEEQLARWRWAQAGLFLGLLLLISSPRYGANFGGALAGAAAFFATLALAVRPRRPLRALLLAGAALMLAGAAVMVWDALRPAAEQTHIGEFAQAVWTGGWPAAAPVLRRKAEMDWRILTSTFAVVPLAGVAPLVGIWYRRAGDWVATLLARRPELRAALGGALVGAWTSLFLKDSGVTPWMFMLGTVLAILLDEQLRSLSA